MIKISTPLYIFLLMMSLVPVGETKAQDVGIGTLSPDHTLHVAANTSTLFKLDNTSALSTGVMSEMYFKTGTHYTGALKTIGNGTVTARLGLFTYAVTNPTALLERMSIMDNGNVGIGTNSPGFLLDVNGRMRVRHGGGSNSAGIYFMDAANLVNRGFIGMEDDNTIGLYGGNGAGWGLTMSTTTGDVSILGSQLYVTSGDPFYTASFANTSGNGHPAVFAEADNVAGMGVGVHSEGGETGLYAIANQGGGSNHRYGVECYGQNGPANNYGIYASGAGGNNAYGIYATAVNGSTNWGGYFSGSIYTTGS